MERQYPIVGKYDEIIDYMSKEEAYKRKKTLRSVQIFVYNPKGELYLQKRAKNKKRFPGYLCASAAGHVEPGETYKKAALRELKEELGLVVNNIAFMSKRRRLWEMATTR